MTETAPTHTASAAAKPTFFGWRVVGGAFVLGVFGWGLGFYGPPVFLSVIHETRGWSLALISAAVTTHYLLGATVGASLHTLHVRFGAAAVTKAAAVLMAVGVVGWAAAREPWQLFAAAALSGLGWAAMSAAAMNAIVSPWFVRTRPVALGMAYNGGSVGGIVFSPLWVAAIGALGFPLAALVIALAMAVTVWVLASTLFSRTPAEMGLQPDGDADGAPVAVAAAVTAEPLPGRLLWRNVRFVTLAAAMALGLFAQIGLVAHLFSLLSPALGAQQAGLAMSLVTVLAIVGRMVLGWVLPRGIDRRMVGAVNYAAQMLGSLAFIAAAGSNVPLLLLGVVLFGCGFGSATSLPPLIAQTEFSARDVSRVVSLIVGISQAFYAFAPAAFGLIRQIVPDVGGAAPWLYAAAALVQALAICALMSGRSR